MHIAYVRVLIFMETYVVGLSRKYKMGLEIYKHN